MNDQHAAPRPRKWLRRLFFTLFVIGGIPLFLLTACQSKLIYFPRPYGPSTVSEWALRSKGKQIDYQTSQGHQQAYLQGQLQHPRNLWIVCGGNGTVALDWSEWLEKHAPREDAWLLFDLPGYGACEGSPSPARIRESLQTVIPMAAEKLGWSHQPPATQLRFLGHSLGCAAVLIAAQEFSIQRGVLIAPFTSTMDMSHVVTGLPVGMLVWHRFDNTARLAELTHRGAGDVTIIHGVDDEVIPITMSRQMAAQNPSTVHLIEIPNGHHNSIQTQQADIVAQALARCGE